MILNPSDWSKTKLWSADVAIVGAGAAGITLALSLAKQGHHCLVLEGGRQMFSDDSQDMYAGSYSARDLPYGLQYSRLRYFGGSTNCWAGGCGELDVEDFTHRDWIPNSGWPITKNDLKNYYQQAADFLELDIDNIREPRRLSDLPHFEGFELRSLAYTKKVRFAAEFLDELSTSKNINVLLDANFSSFERSQPDTVDFLHIKSLDGAHARIKARQYVLAAGGIENARLLLNTSDERFPALGDKGGNLGRYFSDHPIAPVATVYDEGKTAKASELDSKKIKPNEAGNLTLPFYRLPFGIQKKHKTLNVTMQVQSQEAALTEVELAAWRLKKFYENPESYDLIWSDVSKVIASPSRVITAFYSRKQSAGRVALRFQLEQAPSRDNRIVLSEEKDALGLRRAHLHWDFTDLERKTVDVATAYFASALQSKYRSTLMLDPQLLSNRDELPKDLRGGQHHCGTTRMASSYFQGVVDSDLKLFDAENVFVCGSSVFPTNGWVNPTFTILALSLRLGDHLSSVLQRTVNIS